MECTNENIYTNIAHEFYELFQVIQGNLEKMVVDKSISPEGWDRIDSMYGAIRRGKHLINQIMEIEPIVINLSDKESIIGNGETVLFVDDDKQICKLYGSMLESFGYKVIIAREGKTAIDIYCNEFEDIGVIILDIKLPDMTGFDCMDAISDCANNSKIIISTGYLGFDKDSEYFKRVKAVLYKPYSITELMTTVRRVLDE